MFSLIRLTVRRARQERLPQVAGSLTFTTLLAAVPLVAVGFALFTHFPAFERFAAALERYLLASLLPPDLARTVLAHLHRFAANAAELTWLGSLFLLGTALAMLLTIENALNQIWAVRRPRPWLRRIGLYLLVLLAAPPLLGVVLWASSYLLGVSMGWLGPLPPGARFVLDLGPALISCVGLAALFRYVPNTRVRWRDALLGALLASVVLELGKRGFAAYLLKLPTYRAVYGAFAVIPLFLLWAYFSWLVTLGAALITANLPRQG